MSVLLKNNAVSRLGASLSSGATSLSLSSGDGSKFPSPTGGDWFPLTILSAAGTLEIVKCTARASDVLTIVRAQEGTIAAAFSIGDRVELRLTAGAHAGTLADLELKVNGTIQGGTLTRVGTIAGTANAITGVVPDPFSAYANGQHFDFIAAFDNGAGGVTVNWNGLGAIPLTKKGSVALDVGDIKAGAVITIAHDGTRFQIVSGAGGGAINDIFYENNQTITSDYTVSTNKNAGTFGPIAIATGVTVTVPTGSTWSIV